MMSGRIDWRSRTGWLRVWILLSLCWAAFVVHETAGHWSVAGSDITSHSFIGRKAAASFIDVAPRQIDGCTDGSVGRRIQEPPQPSFANLVDAFPLEPLSAADSGGEGLLTRDWRRQVEARLKMEAEARATMRRQYDERVREIEMHGRYVVTTSCIRDTEIARKMGGAFAIAIIPVVALPVTVALIFMVLRSVVRWVVAGFIPERYTEASSVSPNPKRKQRLTRFRFLILLAVAWAATVITTPEAPLEALGGGLLIALFVWALARRSPIERFRLHTPAVYAVLLIAGFAGVGQRYGAVREAGAGVNQALLTAYTGVAGLMILLSIVGLCFTRQSDADQPSS